VTEREERIQEVKDLLDGLQNYGAETARALMTIGLK